MRQNARCSNSDEEELWRPSGACTKRRRGSQTLPWLTPFPDGVRNGTDTAIGGLAKNRLGKLGNDDQTQNRDSPLLCGHKYCLILPIGAPRATMKW